MGKIGAADEYEAYIYDSKNYVKLTALPWSLMRWQRTRNKISAGSCFIAEDDGGIECCGAIGGLRTWSMMLVIERDGTIEWDGPIIGWGRPSITAPDSPRGVEIRALDRFCLTQHRLVGANRVMPSSFGNSIYIANLQQIMLDANLDNPTYDPWAFHVPRYNSGFDDDFIVDVGLAGDQWNFQNQAQAYDMRRELFVDRLDTVYTVVQEIVDTGGLYYCQVGATLHMNEMIVRAWLDDIDPSPDATATTNYDLARVHRPRLDDSTTIDIMGIDVDGNSQATDYFVATAGQGENGFPQIGSANIYGTQFIDGALDLAFNNAQAYTEDPLLSVAENLTKATHTLSVQAQYEAVQAAAPRFTIEQTRLGPEFGSAAMGDDLLNLVPGVLIDIDTESTCAFDVPMVVLDYWYREFTGSSHNGAGYFLTPLAADAVRVAKLEQLDVTVSMTEDGIVEEILASLTPFADWNGELPAGWLEPAYFALGY